MRQLILAAIISSVPEFLGAQEAYDVCRAIKVRSGKDAFVRGIGEFGPDGLVLADATCANLEDPDLKVPAMVLVETSSFESANVRGRYESIRKSESLFQLLARGNLTCAVPLCLKRNTSGDITDANGYGADGLINCRLSNATILKIYEIRERETERQLLK